MTESSSASMEWMVPGSIRQLCPGSSTCSSSRLSVGPLVSRRRPENKYELSSFSRCSWSERACPAWTTRTFPAYSGVCAHQISCPQGFSTRFGSAPNTAPSLGAMRARGKLDAHSWQRAIQPTRHPPDPVANQQHQCRQQDDADDGGVEQNRDRQSDAELTNRRDRRPRERDEDSHHYCGGAGNHAGGLFEPELDRRGTVAGAVVVLPHPHQQEDRVVNRETEDHPKDRVRPHRVDVGVATKWPPVGNMCEQGQDAERHAYRNQVEPDGERR